MRELISSVVGALGALRASRAFRLAVSSEESFDVRRS